MFYQPDHVIAQIAKKPSGGLRHIFGKIDTAFVNQGAQDIQWRTLLWLKMIWIKSGLAVHLTVVAAACPNNVGLHPDDRIATADLAPGHRFEHKSIARCAGELQH